jgi:DNA-directed RNA polymerase beta subunit
MDPNFEHALAMLTSDMLRSFLDAHERYKNYATDTLDAFNFFMKHMLRHMVDENCRVSVQVPQKNQAGEVTGAIRHFVSFSNLSIEKPSVASTEGASRGLRVMSVGGDALTPYEALLRGLTYCASVFVDVRHEVFFVPLPLADGTLEPERPTQEPLVYRNLFLFAMPIAVGSEFCNTFDPTAPPGNECATNKGGYWIVRGNMKVVQPQKQQRHNFHIVRRASKGGVEAQIRSIRPDEKYRSTSTLDLALHAGSLSINIPFLKANQPIITAFRLLGFHLQADVEELVWPGGKKDLLVNAASRRLFSGSFMSELATCPMERLIDVVGAPLPGGGKGADANPEKVRRQVALQVCGELLPHIGLNDTPHTRLKKGLYLGIIVRRMLAVYLGDELPDERDFEGYKFLQTCAATLAILFRQLFNNFNKMLRNRIFDLIKKGKNVDIAALIIRADTMPQLHKAFSDGEVTVQKESSNAGTKVIQIVQQVNMLSLSSHVERVNSPVNRDGKYPMMRNIDPTSLFSTCPTKTPEGDGAGLLQTLTIMSHVRIGTPSADMRSSVLGLGAFAATHPDARAVCALSPLDSNSLAFVRPISTLSDFTPRGGVEPCAVMVFVNSDPIGLTDYPHEFLAVCRAARRAQVFPYDATIVRSNHGILITTDMGVITFPLIYLPNLKRLPLALHSAKLGGTNLWKELLRHGIVEYVDAWETMEYVVAFLPEDIRRGFPDGTRYTHLAPHPCSFFSTAAGTIPFANHNQAPRNCFPAEDHEVLTEHGFKGLTDILTMTEDGKTVGVACFVEHKLQFHQIGRDRVVFEDKKSIPLTSGEFISFIGASGISVLATPNHNMYGRVGFANQLGEHSFRWPQRNIYSAKGDFMHYKSEPPLYLTSEAGDIFNFGSTTLPVTRGKPLVPMFQMLCHAKLGVQADFPDLSFASRLGLLTKDHVDAFLWLYGYWVGDGYLEGERAYVTFDPVKSKDIEMLTSVFARLPLPFLDKRKFSKHGVWKAAAPRENGQWLFSICSKEWWEFFESHHGNKYKGHHIVNMAVSMEPQKGARVFAPWIFTLDADKIRTVLQGLRYADGDEASEAPGGGTIYTSSAFFREDILRACILAGYTAVARLDLCAGTERNINQNGKHIIATQHAWSVRYTNATISTSPWLRIGLDVKPITLSAPVPIFCVTVPTESHLIIVRRRGATDKDAPSRPIVVGNTYQAGMCEQAIGSPAFNVEDRHDMNYSHVLWYPQRPLSTTHIAEVKGVNDWPMGQNLMVAIAPYGGLSQEDAIVVSRSARERGLQRISVYRSHRETAQAKSCGEYETFTHPLAPSSVTTTGIRGEANYDTLGLDGLPEVGARLRAGDALIGKVATSSAIGSDGSMHETRRDRSELMHCDPSEVHTVHAVMVTDNNDGARFVRVRTRTTRDLDVADKISDRHGQKGTIGAAVDDIDLPFVAYGPNEGMVPDVIVNLQAINGRMTIGKLLEMLFGCVGLVSGTIQDATPFLEVDARGAMEDLFKGGYGVEHTMRSGITGELLSHPWFIGPCFYQRLKHMVLDKIAARARGLRAVLTRQPMEGRQNQGGQKMGGMEQDALIAHGAAMALDDRSRVASDAFKAPVCKKCGILGKVVDESLGGLLSGSTRTCRACGSEDFSVLDTTYCYAGLLLGELEAMNIGVKHKFARGVVEKKPLSNICESMDQFPQFA